MQNEKADYGHGSLGSTQTNAANSGELGKPITNTSAGAKFDKGKVGVWMLPTEPLEDIARVLDFGAAKYAAYNWTNGISYSRIYGSLLRHLFAWWRGEDIDSESGLSHLSHAGCNILFLLQFARSRKSFDDRPVKYYKEEVLPPEQAGPV